MNAVTCEQAGCERCGLDVCSYWLDDKEMLLCDRHAQERGFCAACGTFVAGVYDDFAARHDGLCFECWHEYEAEIIRLLEDGPPGAA